MLLDWLNYDEHGVRMDLTNEEDWIMVREGDSGMYFPYYRGQNAAISLVNWNSRPDNFMARMRIDPTAAIILFFCNNNYNHGGVVADSSAFQDLIGPPPDKMPGGWVGLLSALTGKDKNKKGAMMGTDAMATLVWADVNLKKPPTMPKCPPPPGFLGIFVNCVVGIGMAALMLIPGPGEAIGAGAIAGFVTGSASSVTTAVVDATQKPPAGSCQSGSQRGHNG